MRPVLLRDELHIVPMSEATEKSETASSGGVMARISFLPRGDITDELAVRPATPAFTAQEQELIAAWSEIIRQHGLFAEIDTDHEFLPGALTVTPDAAAEPRWIVHKTPSGAVAVRPWPGLAEIVATVPDALAQISEAVDPAYRAADEATS